MSIAVWADADAERLIAWMTDSMMALRSLLVADPKPAATSDQVDY